MPTAVAAGIGRAFLGRLPRAGWLTYPKSEGIDGDLWVRNGV